MKELLYWSVGLVAKLHNYIMRLNDRYEYRFSDKELHFLVIGVLGMGLVFIIYPVFKWLARTHHEMVITWIYVLTLILVITFAIEIGQQITHPGNMEFTDIMFGIVGFLLMFAIFSVIRMFYHLIRNAVKKMIESE